MAKLRSDKFSFELRFINYHINGSVGYNLKFNYGRAPIFSTSLVDKDFFINDHKGEFLISILEKILNRGKKINWEPATSIGLSIKLFRREGKVKEDIFRISFVLPKDGKDTQRWNAVFLQIEVYRFELVKFLSDLQKEYRHFCIKFRVIDSHSVLVKDFERAMRDICYGANKKFGYKSDGLIAFIGEFSGVGAAKRILSSVDIPDSFVRLQLKQISEGSGSEFTVESLVVKPKWRNLFTPAEIKIAQTRLKMLQKK